MKPPPAPRRQPRPARPQPPVPTWQPQTPRPQEVQPPQEPVRDGRDRVATGATQRQGSAGPQTPRRISSRRVDGVEPTPGDSTATKRTGSQLDTTNAAADPQRAPSGRTPQVYGGATGHGPLAERVPVLSSGMADRLAERAAITRHLRVRKLLWALAAIMTVLLGVWLVWFSPVLALDSQEIKINGTGKYVTTQEILAAVAPLAGTPLAKVSMATVHESVAAVENVRDVVQTRRWPNGLTITIEERIPVAGVPQDGAYALLDIDGEIVARQDEAPPELPIIELALTKGTETTLKSVLGILEYLPVELLADIESISATSQDSVNLKLRDGITVHWGSSDETALKLEVLQVLRGTALEEGVKVIDLSAPTFPITR